MPRHDDTGIPGEAILIRAVHPDWTRTENEIERLTSATFLDGQQETSCFIQGEVGGLDGFKDQILPQLSEILGVDLGVATVPVSTVRAAGLWIYRKPDEFQNNPAHVVICPADGMSKSQYAKRAGGLAPVATLVQSPFQNR